MKNAAQWDTEAIERLKELGLTEYDAKVYYTLVAKSPLTAIDISREADVPMSKIYVTLSRLENGGWISVVPERPKQYRAVDPGITVENACNEAAGRLENTKSLLRKSLKETFDRRTGDVEASEFLVVHGTVNALNHLKEIIQSQKDGVTVIAAFTSVRVVERIGDLVKDIVGPKRIYAINEKSSMEQFSRIIADRPYVVPLEAGDRWHDGIVFMYTADAGMYASIEGDEFAMALVIRDRGLLGLMKSFVEISNRHNIMPGPDIQDKHAAMLAAHKAKAAETFDKLVGKRK